MAAQTLTVTLSLSGEEPTEAVATLVHRNPLSRVGRAAVSLLALWGIGAVCVFLPIAHFVLVPGFFIAGLVAAVLRLGEDRSLQHIEGRCPRCKVVRHFGDAGRFREGREIHCEGCGSQLTVRTATGR